MRFLIVDDSSMVRLVLANTLVKLGHSDVIEAGTGRDALDRLGEGRVDVIITDWQMPDMNGIDLVRSVRSSSATREIPILMVTSNALSDDVAEALKSGVSGYVVKPFTRDTIREKIEAILGQ